MNVKIFLKYMYNKIEDNKVFYEIEDCLKKNLRCSDQHRNSIRVQLKQEEETFSDKIEDFYLTYV